MKFTADRLNKAFDALVRAAFEARACPENGTHGVTSAVVGELARQGRVRIAIYAGPIRVVTILAGPYTGLSTFKPNSCRRPHKVIDQSGVRVTGRNHVRQRASKASITLPRLRCLETPEP